jgi:excisionase family DNA binding protein|tara:strand:+ start:808 stop:1287 length:480 start_codon:yes stop_codon:yes gene_type:complete
MTSFDDILTLPQLAKYLGMSPRTIYIWAQQEKIPGFKLGSSWRFRASEINQWMENQRTGPAVESQSRLTDPVSTMRSVYRDELSEKEANLVMIEDCRQDILNKLNDDTRDVWITDDLVDFYGASITSKAIELLRKEKTISIGEEKGLEGKKVQVIRRRI